jgi:demethylmenaquinone methyltransferase/2-methoxy-6-polyprenyl-1,4-benzoquinol methylase
MRNSSGIERIPQSKKQTRAFYDKISHYYDLLAGWSEDSLRREGLEQFNVRQGERILEIGFGTGHMLVLMAASVGSSGQIYGIDLSEEMAKAAARNTNRNEVSDRVYLVSGDAAHLPFESEKFDGIFMSFTLELFDTPEIPQVLAECLRVLRMGGRILVIALSKQQEHETVVEALEWTHKHFPNVLDCRPIFVRQVVEEAGFEIQNVTQKMMWVPVEIVLGHKKK